MAQWGQMTPDTVITRVVILPEGAWFSYISCNHSKSLGGSLINMSSLSLKLVLSPRHDTINVHNALYPEVFGYLNLDKCCWPVRRSCCDTCCEHFNQTLLQWIVKKAWGELKQYFLKENETFALFCVVAWQVLLLIQLTVPGLMATEIEYWQCQWPLNTMENCTLVNTLYKIVFVCFFAHFFMCYYYMFKDFVADGRSAVVNLKQK